jgi:hypothetical protein
MIILSVDPGETTGFALCDSDNRHPSAVGMPRILSTGILSKWRGLKGLISLYEPDVIVAEKFVLYAGRARTFNHDTFVVVRVLGVLEFLAEEANITFIEQSAAVGKSGRIPDKVFDEHRNPHIRDSLKHVMAYLRTAS